MHAAGSKRVLLVSCYELGRQPLGIASPLAHLHAAGLPAEGLDLSVDATPRQAPPGVALIALSAPMHTALRLAVEAAKSWRQAGPVPHLCFFGMYAQLNGDWLLQSGVADSIIAAEADAPLVALAGSLLGGDEPAPIPGVRTRAGSTGMNPGKGPWRPPHRRGLAPLQRYVHLRHGDRHTPAAAVEASRGCRHVCRHCPLTPIYEGRFRAVPVDEVLRDVEAVVAGGAGHITFADPDFLNGPTHALRVARAVHRRFPALTFDFTAKVEHLLRSAPILPELVELGALFAVTAVESLNDAVLEHLHKGHTAADVTRMLEEAATAGLALRPTLIPFTPWSSASDYLRLVDWVGAWGLQQAVDPVQMSIRLLVPPGSPLATLPAMQPHRGELAAADFAWTWRHPEPLMDNLHEEVAALVAGVVSTGEAAEVTHMRIGDLARRRLAGKAGPGHQRQQQDTFFPAAHAMPPPRHQDGWPRLSEPWYC